LRKSKESHNFKNHEKKSHYPTHAVSDIRFNKLPPSVDKWTVPSEDYVSGMHKKIYPMLPEDYPFTGNDITKLSNSIQSETYVGSVVLPGDIELKVDNTAEKWLIYLPNPIYPGDTDEGKYWEEF